MWYWVFSHQRRGRGERMKKHKKGDVKIWRISFFSLVELLGFLGLLGMLGIGKPVMAATPDDQVTLTISQVLESKNGKFPKEEGEFTYQLEALESGNPLPKGSVGNLYDFCLYGTQDITLEPLTFQTVGQYHYQLSLKEVKTDPKFSCDKESYMITVYVTALSGGGVRADAIATVRSGLKTEKLSFEHQYQSAIETPRPEDTSKKPRIKDSTGGIQTASMVKTGDLTNINRWLIITIVSLVIILGGMMLRKKQSK